MIDFRIAHLLTLGIRADTGQVCVPDVPIPCDHRLDASP